MCHRLEEAELSRLDRVEEACVGRHVTGQGVVGRSSEKRNREGLVLEPAVVALHFSPCVHRVHIVAPHAVGGIPGTLFLFSPPPPFGARGVGDHCGSLAPCPPHHPFQP